MSAGILRSAGIIAAGEGSRFKARGVRLPKPLIPVAGRPLIAHALSRLQGLGMKRVVIIFNERERDCPDWVRRNFPGLQTEFIVKSTESSFESFWRVGRRLGPGRHLISTVDSLCGAAEWRKMARRPASGGIHLGVTGFVDDEKPLWVRLAKGSRRVAALGTESGRYATAGFYNVPGSIFPPRFPRGFKSLRWFLKDWVDRGAPVYAVPLAKVMDVDRPEDVEKAEIWLRRIGAQR